MFFILPLIQLAVNPLWCPKGIADDADSHVAFRGRFTTSSPEVKLQLLGASSYLVWLDGKLVAEGPARFALAYPEYQTVVLHPSPGAHVLAVHAHNDGATTRMLSTMPPFFWCRVSEGAVDWKCARIPGYRPRARRISDILGWIDWVDTSAIWPDWQAPQFDDSSWLKPADVDPGIGPMKEANLGPLQMIERPMRLLAQGRLTENYGYENDDPAVRFFLRDLDPQGVPSQGVWRRYDLGRVRLGRPVLTLDLPKRAVVEMVQCEQLRHGRGHAWITLSGSNSCNFDHFIARGGPQEFMPTSPKGGRFVEVHVLAPGAIKFEREAFLERTYYGEPEGSFECSDPLLNRIWQTGVETVRACSEDSLVDCPTRERGEWTGDVASVSTDICAVAYSDMRLSRRGLVQAAQVARADGLVAGVGPGDPGYLSTYAAQWATACVHYWELSGDKTLLQELWPAAERNMAAFRAKMTPVGVSGDLGWGFVDWGYVGNAGPSDMALNLHYLMALRAMGRWQRAVGATTESDYTQEANHLERIIRTWLKSAGGWDKVGYHRAALALLAGLVDDSEVRACIQSIERHLLICFPNDPSAPRLSDPSVSNDRLMTPYFAHFAFAALLEHGETEFVLGQFRKCWGWALGDGRTTWLEVFDTRWSHCHEWSGCPTWQLTRFVLGVRPRLDRGDNLFELAVQPGSLKFAKGVVPLAHGGKLRVEWRKQGSRVRLKVQSDRPVRLRIKGEEFGVNGLFETSLTR